jgi:hypothetical protein
MMSELGQTGNVGTSRPLPLKNGRLALPAKLSGSKVRNFIGGFISEIRRSVVMECLLWVPKRTSPEHQLLNPEQTLDVWPHLRFGRP